nr:retrovirus-related Pol polyprotein from transposon TNT 1-94 [Tanacetum cinerariifolium]
MALALMAKAFKLNYSTPTNNNQKISSNPRNRQIAQPGMNMGQDRQMQMNVKNQVAQNAIQNLRVQNVGNHNGQIGVPGNANQNGNGNLVAGRVEGNETGQNGNQIRCYNCRGVANLAEIKEVNANCILMANLQQALTSGTQTDKALVYDSDGSGEVHKYENCYDDEIFNMFTQEEQYTELLEPIPEPHQVPQNDNNVIFEAEAIATACFTQNRSIIHRRFNKTPYELISGRKPDISFLYVFEALCYPKNNREDIGKLGAKAMAFEQRSLKPGLQSMTSAQISSGLDLTYAPSTITTQQPNEGELDLLFEAMYDYFIGGQPATIFPNTSQDVDELNSQQQHVQQQGNQVHL